MRLLVLVTLALTSSLPVDTNDAALDDDAEISNTNENPTDIIRNRIEVTESILYEYGAGLVLPGEPNADPDGNDDPLVELLNEDDADVSDLLVSRGFGVGGRGGGGGSSYGGWSSSGSSGSSGKGGSSSGSSGSSGSSDKKGGGGGRGGGGGSSGGSSGGKGGSDGGKGGSNGGSSGNRGGTEDPPPPYSPREGNNRGPPPPYSPGTYGNRGSYRNGWNGQYYPYSSYGYASTVPVGLAFAPFFLAGPYGFYGPYGAGAGGANRGSHDNATVPNMYVNGTKLGNGTWVNGTFLNETYDDGKYTVFATQGSYVNGTELGDVVVNGTFVNPVSTPRRTNIDPNVTANGTTLHASNNSAYSAPHWTWLPLFVAATAMIL